MMNSFTYPTNNSARWLMSIFLALSCFAFSLNPVPTQARQHLPAQVENVVSSKDVSDNKSISFFRIVDIISSHHIAKPEREYKRKILIAHQIETDVGLKHMSDQHLSYSTIFQPSNRITPQPSDEDLPPTVI